MVELILDKIKFYQTDIINEKLYLSGRITGLNPTKNYCLWWQCGYCDRWYYVNYSDTIPQMFIRGVDSFEFGAETHINASKIVFDENKNVSNIQIYVDEVGVNCDIVMYPLLDHKEISVSIFETPLQEAKEEMTLIKIATIVGVGGLLIYLKYKHK